MRRETREFVMQLRGECQSLAVQMLNQHGDHTWAMGSTIDKVRTARTNKWYARVMMTNAAAPAQVNSIANKNLFLTEAYIHALVNIKGKPLLVLDSMQDYVQPTVYHPGFGAMKMTTRADTVRLLKEGSAACVYLDRARSHFEAMLPPKAMPSPTKRSKKQRVASYRSYGGHAGDAIELDD